MSDVQDICNSLIKGGADINAADEHGDTPLMVAVLARSEPGIRALIQAGADMNLTNNYGLRALTMEMECFRHTMHERLELLLSGGADVKLENKSTLFKAVSRGFCFKCVDLMIKGAADVKYDSFGCLDVACRKLRDKCVKLLIDAGADVNMVLPNGHTVLFAAPNSDVRCIKLVIEAGVPVNHYDRCNLNVLQNFVKKHGSNKAELGLLLYVAGEKLDVPEDLRLRRHQRRLKAIEKEIPKYLKQEEGAETTQDLDKICRKVIRKRLLDVDQHGNLFLRIPKLPLPTCIISFLLFGYSVKG